jgi:hypothetical protein
MKSIIINISLAGCCFLFFSSLLIGQDKDPMAERIEILKDRLGFDSWKSAGSQVIAGVDIEASILPQLRSLQKVWREDNYSRTRIGENTYTRVRKWWRAGEEEYQISMVVAPSYEAAKEYLIRTYAETQRDISYSKTPGQALGLSVGDIRFAEVEENRTDNFISIDFIRNNVIVLTEGNGPKRSQLPQLAQEIDKQLQENQGAARLELLPEAPSIQTFSLERSPANQGEEILISLEINNPVPGEVKYFWDLSGGGVRKDLAGNFVYQATENGNQQISLTIVNRVGLAATQTVQMNVQ